MSGFQHIEKVRHIRDGNIAFTVVSKKLSETLVQYQVAYCSPKDNFVKKEGIAVARDSDLSYTVDIEQDSSFKDINFAIVVNMIKNRDHAPRSHRDYLDTIFNKLTEY